MNINNLKQQIFNGTAITRPQAIELITCPWEPLQAAANEIRARYCADSFELCTIINAKSGRCSENCRFCAQSSHYFTDIKEYPLLNAQQIIQAATYNAGKGISRFSVVTSGRRLSQSEVDTLAEIFANLKATVPISLCLSCGLLSKEQFVQLKAAGLTRYHNNLETSRRFFPEICSTHSYDDKIQALQFAQQSGLELCSGGIIGMGESMIDRIDLAFEVLKLGVKSMPINILNPIPGTPLERQAILSEMEAARTIAIIRFILPDKAIRLAGGRGLFPDKGKLLFESGASAAISGDMLTTAGICIDDDKSMLNSLGLNQ